jgi:glutathione-regulated potassium-efflux system ancillary protein KefC
MALGVDVFERETFRSALTLATSSLVALGYEPERAQRLGEAFADHDIRMLHQSYELRDDEDAYIGFVRQSVEMLGSVLEADEARGEENGHSTGDSDRARDRRDIDNGSAAGSR